MPEDEKNVIDVTPLLTLGTKSQSARKLQNLLYPGLETDANIDLPFPNGTDELEWSVEQCEHFMEIYLGNERPDSRWQNKRRWNYAVWRFIVDLYADGIRFADIAKRVIEQFECYRVPDALMTRYTVKSIISYRGWRVAARMKTLIAQDRVANILASRRIAAVEAEKLELDVVGSLREQLESCVSTLALMHPADPQYSRTVGSIEKLKGLIASISGLDAIRSLEVYREKQNIKLDSAPKVAEEKDPRSIVPQIVSR